MKFTTIAAAAFLFLPSLTSASEVLDAKEMKTMASLCLRHFKEVSPEPIAIDRKRLAKMGFAVMKDEPYHFEAQRVLFESRSLFGKRRSGPLITLYKSNRKPQKLLFWRCTIDYGLGEKSPSEAFTKMSSSKVYDIITKEAKKVGYKPYRGKRGGVVWIKSGSVPLDIDVSYMHDIRTPLDGKAPPSRIVFTAADARELQ